MQITAHKRLKFHSFTSKNILFKCVSVQKMLGNSLNRHLFSLQGNTEKTVFQPKQHWTDVDKKFGPICKSLFRYVRCESAINQLGLRRENDGILHLFVCCFSGSLERWFGLKIGGMLWTDFPQTWCFSLNFTTTRFCGQRSQHFWLLFSVDFLQDLLLQKFTKKSAKNLQTSNTPKINECPPEGGRDYFSREYILQASSKHWFSGDMLLVFMGRITCLHICHSFLGRIPLQISPF